MICQHIKLVLDAMVLNDVVTVNGDYAENSEGLSCKQCDGEWTYSYRWPYSPNEEKEAYSENNRRNYEETGPYHDENGNEVPSSRIRW